MNHHLFFADLAIRQDDFGSILPEYSAVIFDEAHEIEDVASDYFGRQISSYRFEELARDTENMLRVLRIEARAAAQTSGAYARDAAARFFEKFPGARGPVSLWPGREASLSRSAIARLTTSSTAALKRVEAELSALIRRSPKK